MHKSGEPSDMHADSKPAGWADRPQIQQRIRYALYAAAVVLALADFIVHRHTVIALERLPVFYAIYGFVALVVTVQLAKGLRRVVGREENYYEKPAKPVKKVEDDDDE